VLVKPTPDVLELDPAISTLAAWVRGNGRLAAVFERSEQVAVLPMPGEGPSYLQLVVKPGRAD
jgi:hypothetical protein